MLRKVILVLLHSICTVCAEMSVPVMMCNMHTCAFVPFFRLQNYQQNRIWTNKKHVIMSILHKHLLSV